MGVGRRIVRAVKLIFEDECAESLHIRVLNLQPSLAVLFL